MPVFEKKRKIDVVAKKKTGGGYSFEMFEKVGGNPIKRTELIFDKAADDVYKLGWYKVEFKLVAEDSDLKFHEDEAEVFWIGVAGKDGCPAPYCQHHPITATRQGDSKIVVRNPDRQHETLAFALGFQDGDDPAPIRYDPVWGNKNGGVEFVPNAQVLATGAGILGLIALGGWALSQASRGAPAKKRKHR